MTEDNDSQTSNPHAAAWRAITADERYQQKLDWGAPRRGHPEGTVRAHIRELDANLARLRPRLTDADYWKLKLLIHVHDTFKAEALRGCPIAHPQSHASLARAFLAEFCDDPDLLAMVQWHDEPFALWRGARGGQADSRRLERLLNHIADWSLFTTFLAIDNCTDGKNREPLVWFLVQIAGRVETGWTAETVAAGAW